MTQHKWWEAFMADVVVGKVSNPKKQRTTSDFTEAYARELLKSVDKPRSLGVLNLRYGIDRPTCLLQEISDLYGVTVQRIRQVINETLQQLQTKHNKLQVK